MSNKCFKNMSLKEAIAWAEKNTAFADVRNRMASRMVVYLLYNTLKEGQKYVIALEKEHKTIIEICKNQQEVIEALKQKLKEKTNV